MNAEQIIRKALHAAREIAAETLWPTQCAGCDAIGVLLCDACCESLHYIDVLYACPICGAPYGSIQCSECNGFTLAERARDAVPFDALASVVLFDDLSARIITTYKDKHEPRLAHDIAALMARYVHPLWMRQANELVITYIPATEAARKRRGFDHAQRLAQALANELGLSCEELLMRPRTRDQRRLSRNERSLNMSNAFSVHTGTKMPLAVLLIDDVCTTGATIYAACDALREAGCVRIYALTFARVCN